MSTPWKNSRRIEARKILKRAGLDKDVVVNNSENTLGDDEIAVLSPRRKGEFLPQTPLWKAFEGASGFKLEACNECMAVLKIRKVGESA